jgi:hypothetical protein
VKKGLHLLFVMIMGGLLLSTAGCGKDEGQPNPALKTPDVPPIDTKSGRTPAKK